MKWYLIVVLIFISLMKTLESSLDCKEVQPVHPKGNQSWVFIGGLEVKASAWNAGDPGSIPGLGRSPGEGKWHPTPVLLPGESHGGRSLVRYSPWGHKELDMTE